MRLEGFDEDKITFFSKRFQHLYKKKRSPRRDNGAKGSSSRENKDEPKVCLNYEKRCHFVVECPDLQTDKPKKESNKKETFKKNVKKSLMTTCKCLDAE